MTSAVRVAVLSLLWGSTFLWIDLALEAFTPVQVTFIRCALGSALLLILCRVKGHRLPRERGVWGRVLVAAFFCNALPFALFSVGQQTVDSGAAGVLNATTPLWSLLLGLLLGGERPLRAVRVVGLSAGFAGTALIFAPWEQSTPMGWGALAIVGAAGSYAVAFVLMGRHLVGRGVPTLPLAASQLIAATALTAPTLPFGGFTPVRDEPRTLLAVAAVVVLGLFATGLTFYLTYRIIADEGATHAATVGYLLPVVSVVLGAVVLGEEIGARVVAGMAVVLLGVAMTRRRVRPPSEAGAAAIGPAGILAAGPGERPVPMRGMTKR
ncbi:DMT family transporter [Streptomyces sp. NPDC048383]|uniref:DMT family transporter n=1 Tax=Streptomyces sp. NPDC048383 TaxID=3155386 RepID=UPI00342C1567